MAKKKIKRISVNMLDEMMKNGYDNQSVVEWNGIEVAITKTLPLTEMLSFVDSVVKSCFDRNTNAYMPEVKDFAIRSNVMERYANFTLPSNIERQYEVVMCSGAYEMILKHVNLEQYYELIRAIDAKIQNVADANIQMVFKQFNDVVAAFEGLQDKLAASFAGIDASDVSKLMSTITEKGFDEEKIVQAYLDQKKAE